LTRIVGLVPGVAAGAAIGSVAGTPGAIVGAISGTVLEEIGADVASRLLSPREERRVGAVILAASAAYVHNQEFRGQTPRDDGFLDGGNANGAEFVEGVMLAAKDSYEERKVPYLGNLLANIAFNPGMDLGTANTALRLGENASWLELVVLGVFADEDTYPMPRHELPHGHDWETWSQMAAARRLLEPPRELLKHAARVGARGAPGYDLNLDAMSLTSGGSLITGLMELTTIERSERDPIYATLRAGDPDGEPRHADS
jgi:hypothetical protein